MSYKLGGVLYMKSKKLLGVICAFLMMFSASVAVLSDNSVFAAETVKYYYGSTLASTGDGSSKITSSLSNGLQITFEKASKDSSASYKNALDMNDFAVNFRFDSVNFDEFWFKFTDNDNDTKWVQLSFKVQDGKISYKMQDNNHVETAFAATTVSSDSLSSETGLTLSYDKNSRAFSLNGVTLNSGDIKTLSFYKNIADMSFGVKGVSGDEEDNDAVIQIKSIKSSNGTQTLVTANSKFEGENRIAPVIIPKEDGKDQIVTSDSAVNVAVNAAADSTYGFPYFCLDILGTGWAVSVTQDGAEGEKVEGKTSQAIGSEGSVYTIKIYALKSDENPLITLKVTAKKDTAEVTVNDEAFKSFISNAEVLKVDHLVASTEGNTFEFPHIDSEEFSRIVTVTDGLDDYSNVKIQVGYLAPGSSGEFTYASSYAVKLNKTGTWYFRYKFTDPAGNITESEPFAFRVFDETPPTITVESSVEIDVNQKYTIPTGTITDNASGVDTAYSTWKLYYLNADGSRGAEIKNLKEGEEGYEDSILKDGVLTPKELTAADLDGSFVIVYQARDLDGNVAEEVETIVKVVEGTPDYSNNPFNDFLRVALIVVACLAGTGIIVLIFVRPKERELK